MVSGILFGIPPGLARRHRLGLLLLLASAAFALILAAQLAHARFYLVHKAQMVVIAHDGHRSHGQLPLHVGAHRMRPQIGQPQVR
jgi:hypothetical protein